MVNKYFSVLPNLLPKNDPRYIKWLASLSKRPSPWNKGKTRDNHLSVRKISETFKRKRLDNFVVWRDQARREGRIANTDLPLVENTELAFLIGLFLGDGHLEKMRRTELLQITLGTDKPLLWQYAFKVVEKTFQKKPTLRKRTDSKCVDIRIYQNNIGKRLRVPNGSRKNIPIRLPKWIWKNNNNLKQAIKGLFEAEGSFSIHLKTYTYNFSFSNTNVYLLNEVEKALIKFGYHPERRLKEVRLRKKQECLDFERFINFRRYPLV